MTDSNVSHLVAAGLHLLPALLWGILAWECGRFVLIRRPRSPLFLVMALVTGITAFHYIVHLLIELTPTEFDGLAPGLHTVFHLLINVSVILSVACFRHMVLLLPVPVASPRRVWLAINYGSAVLFCAPVLLMGTAPGRFGLPAVAPDWLALGYSLAMSTLALRQLARLARRGVWRPGTLAELRSADVVVLACGLFGFALLVAMVFFVASGSMAAAEVSLWGVSLHTAFGLALAVPFAMRMLGQVVRAFLMVATMTATAAGIYAGTHALVARLPSPELAGLLDLVAIVGFALLLVAGRSWLDAAIDWLVFRRGRLRRAELQAFLHTLSPELSVRECCERALAELTRVMSIRGAAVLLGRDGSAVSHGEFALEALVRAWPRGEAADALPTRGLWGIELRELPPTLWDALGESGVVWVVPIISPRHRWGHLLATEALLAAPLSDEDVAAVEAFTDQLARVLDGAELLARTVAVERSLAHSEKLAAIGELAARIAHEIRNPVTAARSLAQQLAREPESAYAAEHAVILAELERVERQVAALLRFARREEFHFEPVDLGELVRATLGPFRPRLEAAGIEVALEAKDGLTVRADREKLRQVLINLIENAIDALGERSAARQLRLQVGGVNGVGMLRVTDSGPGVAPDVLPHLFEPFFSGKEHGTGLGLAIAKRTVDAHGGRIEAESVRGAGVTFRVSLPLAGSP